MNKFLVSSLLFAAIGATFAIQFKKDDTPELKKKSEEIKNDNLENWKFASQMGDTSTMRAYLTTLHETLKKAEENNNKVLPGIRKIGDKMKAKADKAEDSWIKKKELELMAGLIDGNRDNISYYTLDAANNFLEARKATAPNAEVRARIEKAQKLIVKARDMLDTMAHVFVNAVKEVKAELKNSNPDFDKIKATIDNLVATFDNKNLENATTDAINASRDIDSALV